MPRRFDVKLSDIANAKDLGKLVEETRDRQLAKRDECRSNARTLNDRIKKGQFAGHIELDYLVSETPQSLCGRKSALTLKMAKELTSYTIAHYLDPTAVGTPRKDANGRPNLYSMPRLCDDAVKTHLKASRASFDSQAKNIFLQLKSSMKGKEKQKAIDEANIQEMFIRRSKVTASPNKSGVRSGDRSKDNPLTPLWEMLSNPMVFDSDNVKFDKGGGLSFFELPLGQTVHGGKGIAELHLDTGQEDRKQFEGHSIGSTEHSKLFKRRLILAFFRTGADKPIHQVNLLERIFFNGSAGGGRRISAGGKKNEDYFECEPLNAGYIGLEGVVSYFYVTWKPDKQSFIA